MQFPHGGTNWISEVNELIITVMWVEGWVFGVRLSWIGFLWDMEQYGDILSNEIEGLMNPPMSWNGAIMAYLRHQSYHKMAALERATWDLSNQPVSEGSRHLNEISKEESWKVALFILCLALFILRLALTKIICRWNVCLNILSLEGVWVV